MQSIHSIIYIDYGHMCIMKEINMDRRTEKTEKAFTDALFHFLKEKELKKITVKELCDYCNVGRSTFYLHYYDIYDLMEKTEQRMINKIFEYVPDDTSAMPDHILKSFEYIKDHREEYKIFFSTDTAENFSTKLCKTLANRSKEQVKTILPDTDDKITENVVMFYVGGAVSLLYGWVVENNCETSPIELLETANSFYDYLYKEKQRIIDGGNMTLKENAVNR